MEKPSDGSGNYSLPAGYLAVAGQIIQPSQHNPPLEDVASALSDSISRTGVTAITADIPLAGFKLTGLGDATNPGDALSQQAGDARYPQSSGFSNLVINGAFRVNQRAFAGGALAAGVFGFDRWKASTGGANYSVASGVCTISSGSIEQVIEGLSIVTGTYSINWTGTATCTVDGAFANCTIKFTGAGATLSEVQVVRGSFQGVFEVRPYSVELALCMRYYQRRATPLTLAWGPFSPGGIFYSHTLSAPMRVAPTSTVVVAPGLINVTGFSVSPVDAHSFYVAATATGPEGPFQIAGDGTIAFDAEI